MRTGSVTTIGASPKRILGFTLSILFFLSFTSFAHGSRCEEQFKQVKRPIEEVFYQDKWNSYQYGMCHQNVIRLLRQFEKEGHPV
ncbi:MAG: hypothetical protein U1E10_16490, partial [Bdellovibrionales bacterium]|nr:hypothetical protein [Bdellovibrionales bacterium]